MGDRPPRPPHLDGAIPSASELFRGELAGPANVTGRGAYRSRVVHPAGVIDVEPDGLRIAPGNGPAWVGYGPFDAQAGLTFCVHFLLDAETVGESTAGLPAPGPIGGVTGGFAATLARARQLLLALARRVSDPFGRATPATRASGWSIGWFTQSGVSTAAHGFALRQDASGAWAVLLESQGRLRPASPPTMPSSPYYMVSLRRRGAAYYLPAGPSVSATVPAMRPVGIAADATRPRFAAVRRDPGASGSAVVRAVLVGAVPSLASWFGSAHFADRLVGAGDLHHSVAEIGGMWQVAEGRLWRAHSGVHGLALSNRAMALPPEPSGLVHVEIDGDLRQGRVVLFFRHFDDRNCWRLLVRQRTTRLSLLLDGDLIEMFSSRLPAGWPAAGRRSLEIVDDGRDMAICIDGRPVSRPIRDERLAGAVGLGFTTLGAVRHLHLRNIEAHPRTVPLPPGFVLPAAAT